MILVTGGAGFIGSNFIRDWFSRCQEPVINLDKLTYAGNLQNVAAVAPDHLHIFLQRDISESAQIALLLNTYKPRAIIHFAAQTHVDRSIQDPSPFVHTNINGTFSLLEVARLHYSQLSNAERSIFRFLHVSTDEVYGSLMPADSPLPETAAYAPNNPYSASKAAADHLVRSYYRTYGLPTLITICTNNYGRYQFPEKLIPLIVANAIAGRPLPLYGDGKSIRDWLYVHDNCDAINKVLAGGKAGETYHVSSGNERTNVQVVEAVCSTLDEFVPLKDGAKYHDQITYVQDRPGHDRRYALDASKIRKHLSWNPTETFESGIRKTVKWYLDNQEWIRKAQLNINV